MFRPASTAWELLRFTEISLRRTWIPRLRNGLRFTVMIFKGSSEPWAHYFMCVYKVFLMLWVATVEISSLRVSDIMDALQTFSQNARSLSSLLFKMTIMIAIFGFWGQHVMFSLWQPKPGRYWVTPDLTIFEISKHLSCSTFFVIAYTAELMSSYAKCYT